MNFWEENSYWFMLFTISGAMYFGGLKLQSWGSNKRREDPIGDIEDFSDFADSQRFGKSIGLGMLGMILIGTKIIFQIIAYFLQE